LQKEIKIVNDINTMSRIVMANIQMPILVKNGTLKPLSEYIKIQIEACEKLPEKNIETDGSIMDQINRILAEQDNVPPKEVRLVVSKDELLETKSKKQRKNISFKNTSKTMSKYTMKNYQHLNSNTSDVDPSQLQEAEELTLVDD
jgi:hypothetical protein